MGLAIFFNLTQTGKRILNGETLFIVYGVFVCCTCIHTSVWLFFFFPQCIVFIHRTKPCEHTFCLECTDHLGLMIKERLHACPWENDTNEIHDKQFSTSWLTWNYTFESNKFVEFRHMRRGAYMHMLGCEYLLLYQAFTSTLTLWWYGRHGKSPRWKNLQLNATLMFFMGMCTWMSYMPLHARRQADLSHSMAVITSKFFSLCSYYTICLFSKNASNYLTEQALAIVKWNDALFNFKTRNVKTQLPQQY